MNLSKTVDKKVFLLVYSSMTMNLLTIFPALHGPIPNYQCGKELMWEVGNKPSTQEPHHPPYLTSCRLLSEGDQNSRELNLLYDNTASVVLGSISHKLYKQNSSFVQSNPPQLSKNLL